MVHLLKLWINPSENQIFHLKLGYSVSQLHLNEHTHTHDGMVHLLKLWINPSENQIFHLKLGYSVSQLHLNERRIDSSAICSQ